MKLACIHCGKAFVIRAEQLGTRGACPHCHGEIHLPKADDAPEEKAAFDLRLWFDHLVSGLTSMIVHMMIFLGLVLFESEGTNTLGPGEVVRIGTLPEEVLATNPADELQSEQVTQTQSPSGPKTRRCVPCHLYRQITPNSWCLGAKYPTWN